jgi:hypothetical protein
VFVACAPLNASQARQAQTDLELPFMHTYRSTPAELLAALGVVDVPVFVKGAVVYVSSSNKVVFLKTDLGAGFPRLDCAQLVAKVEESNRQSNSRVLWAVLLVAVVVGGILARH